MNSSEKTILVVDDRPTNLSVVAEYLEAEDFEIMVAQDGTSGLEIAKIAQPDIVLLDVMMPGIDGFETCRRLKQDKSTEMIPVIFMTALSDVKDKVKGFEAGGVDYITKPIQQAEVLARVNLQLNLRRLTEQLQRSNAELMETLDNLKITQNQLIESEKMAALGNLVAGVAHEINTPLGIALTAVTTLQSETELVQQNLQNNDMTRLETEDYIAIVNQSNRMVTANLRRAADLVQSFKRVAVDRSNLEKQTFALIPYLEEVLLSLRPTLKKNRCTITIIGDKTIVLDSYPGLLAQVFTNLVMNSIHHAYPDGESTGILSFKVADTDHSIRIEYVDDGCGISKDHLSKVFDPFFTTSREKGGTGLGLHIVYNLMTQTLQGSIHCESRVGEGTKFILELPQQIKD